MCMYVRMKKSSGFLCFALFLSSVLCGLSLCRVCGILKRDERRERRVDERATRERRPPVFQKKRPQRVRKKSREKKIRATQKKRKERRRKKNVDESSVSRAVVVHRRERVGTKAVARGDRRKRRRAFV